MASSLDGFIAGPNGEYMRIVIDPEIDFAAMYQAYGGLVMGRKSYEVAAATEMPGPALPTYVYSRTLPEGERHGVTLYATHNDVRTLKETTDGKPLWLWGGGELFGQLARAGLVDGIEVAVIPVVLGAGIPLMSPKGPRLSLELRRHRLYAGTGTMFLEYDVRRT